jgi:hypothetical protein
MIEAVGREYWPACSEAGFRVGHPGVRQFAVVK